MQIPNTLNGYPVIKSTAHGNGYATVMCDKGDGELVVATWWPDLQSCWMWGHYWFDRSKAEDSFKIVSERNEGRG